MLKFPKPAEEGWLTVALIGLLAAGIILIALPAIAQWTWDYGIIHEVGIALTITGGLGLTVDHSLKSRLARDVVEAALGYVFPDEFRAEVRQLTSYKFFCERHRMEIKVEIIDTECVRVIWSAERRLKNIASNTEATRGYVHIDEWGFGEKSKIFDCRARIEGRSPVLGTIQQDAASLWSETDNVHVQPKQYVDMSTKSMEVRRINDQMVFVYMSPTSNPVADIDLPPELECSFGFGSPHAKTEKSEYSYHYSMTGTYFPHQYMRFRWWPKQKAT